ncbi:hypothetical protein CR513_42003, partial [Mucuna pruriens]
MKAREEGVNILEELSGFIFMCNTITKPECYRYRVFGLPAGRKDVVEKINPVFVRVKFKIYKHCLPLPENSFKHAIQDNYQKGSNKFNPELNIRQVKSLLELFYPLYVLPTAPTHPFLKKPMNNVYHQISGPPVSEDAYLSRMSSNQAPRIQSVPFQASRNQHYSPASTLTLEGTCAPGMGSIHTPPLPDPQYSHQTILNPQPEFHSSLVIKGSSGYTQTLQNSQHAHHNSIHPQPEFHSSLMTMSSSHTQTLQDPQYPYQRIPNPSHDFHSPVANAGSGYAQLLPDRQHTHQNAQNPQPNLNSSLVNMGHTNFKMQSHVSSSFYHPYVPQEVVSSTYSFQGSGAIQGVISSGQQTGMGNVYYQSSVQTETTQENVVNHLYSTNSYS